MWEPSRRFDTGVTGKVAVEAGCGAGGGVLGRDESASSPAAADDRRDGIRGGPSGTGELLALPLPVPKAPLPLVGRGEGEAREPFRR